MYNFFYFKYNLSVQTYVLFQFLAYKIIFSLYGQKLLNFNPGNFIIKPWLIYIIPYDYSRIQ